MNLIDVFMPNDLCARCDEYDPLKDVRVLIQVGEEKTLLAFCSVECKEAFVRGSEAIKELPDVF
jgi:hypothetical protein